ncbi:hypothetical protein DFH08DRAFT_979327 [Mycena albidolilacea]|uniref:Uncharacterized protein n=1 Tax=Mycena albidolilacea TaxID=1033008 RepID=A0AAD6YWX5_9AGAR|nr:hypothetical protein DFH08DRAFT_979327 [Mycena albidolilacea]
MSDSTTQRGSGRLVKDDVNVMFWYIQDKDGKTVSGKHVKAMRAHARHIWSHLLSINKLPDKWSNATSVVQNYYAGEMRRPFPELQLCDLDYKSHRITTEIFPGWRTTYITNKAPIKLESDIDDDLDDNVTKADNNEHGLVVGNKRSATAPPAPEPAPKKSKSAAKPRSLNPKPVTTRGPKRPTSLASTAGPSSAAPALHTEDPPLPLSASSTSSSASAPSDILSVSSSTSAASASSSAVPAILSTSASASSVSSPGPAAISTTSGSVSALTALICVFGSPAISSEVSSIPTPPPIPPPVAAPPSPDHTALDLLARAALRTDVPIEKPVSQGPSSAVTPGSEPVKSTPTIPVAGPSMVDNPLAHLGRPSGPTTRAEHSHATQLIIYWTEPAKSATEFMRVTKTNSAKNLCLKKYIEDNGEVTKEVFNAYFDSLGKAQLKVFQDASKQANKAKKDQTVAAPAP